MLLVPRLLELNFNGKLWMTPVLNCAETGRIDLRRPFAMVNFTIDLENRKRRYVMMIQMAGTMPVCWVQKTRSTSNLRNNFDGSWHVIRSCASILLRTCPNLILPAGRPNEIVWLDECWAGKTQVEQKAKLQVGREKSETCLWLVWPKNRCDAGLLPPVHIFHRMQKAVRSFTWLFKRANMSIIMILYGSALDKLASNYHIGW